MGKNRLELRRMAEAAEALGDDEDVSTSEAKKKPRKAAKRKATARKTREKSPERKRIVWIIYSGSMKEEGRFPYDQKEAAEERLQMLQSRGKRLYFLQRVKELVTDQPVIATMIDPILDEDDEEAIAAAAAASRESDEEGGGGDELADVEVDEADFDDDGDGDGDDDGDMEESFDDE